MRERECVEEGCSERAGTPWTPLWCPAHDAERRARLSVQMNELLNDCRAAAGEGNTDG